MIYRATAIFIISIFQFSITARSQTFTHNVDSFRLVIQEGFDYNTPIEITDTFTFLKQGLYSFVNYDNTSTFDDIFLCYEPGYRKLPEPRFAKYRNTALTMKRDIRILFLFYLDQYLLRSNNNNSYVDKFSQISMIDLKTKKPYDIQGDKAFENVIELYRKLIITVEKKEFKNRVLNQKELSMLEFAGYKWVIVNEE